MPRVAVVLPYWTFWEASVGPDLRSGRLQILGEAADLVANMGAEVVWQGMVDSQTEGHRAAAEAFVGEPDVVLVVQSMAVPPTHALAFLEHLGLPVVIWAAQKDSAIPADFSESHITSMGSTVGTPMLTNVLHRHAQAFRLVVSPLDDEAAASEVVSMLRAGAVAQRLRGARVARVGRPVDGYLCVDADDEDLRRALGIEVVSIAPDEIHRRYMAVSGDELGQLHGEVQRDFAWSDGAGASDDTLIRSLRLAAAFCSLDSDEGFAAGAINCHVPEIRFGDPLGVTPCFGLGRETTRGVPWTCAGDILTAVAMLVTKGLSGASLYHEIEAIDFETGEVAVANSGEHDLGWCSPGDRPVLGPNPWYASDERTGYRALFEMAPGPATLVGFVHQPGHRAGFGLVAAEGEITGRELPENPTVGGMFRFANGTAAQAWARWVQAGVNHHSAASPGHLGAQVAAVAAFADIGFTSV